MSVALIIGNFFSLLSAICLAISVIKKNKNDLILWQVWCIVLANVACFALKAYAALITGIIDLIRNLLTYENRLTGKITAVLVVLCIIIGLIVNNLGIIGILAIVASTSYTVFMYTTKDEQQMRWALILNQVLWLIHDTYIQVYPAALTDAVMAVWTLVQAILYIRHKKNTGR